MHRTRTLIAAALGSAILAATPFAVAARVAQAPAPVASPSVLSIQFTDEATAQDYYDEARSLGEAVCLTPMTGADGVARLWLHTCSEGR